MLAGASEPAADIDLALLKTLRQLQGQDYDMLPEHGGANWGLSQTQPLSPGLDTWLACRKCRMR